MVLILKFIYIVACYSNVWQQVGGDELLKYVTGRHHEGWSFNGAFAGTDIVWVGGRVFIKLTKVRFDEHSCRKSMYMQINTNTCEIC